MPGNSCAHTLGIESRGRHCGPHARANLQQVVAKGAHTYFEECVAETERLLVNNDQRGFYTVGT